MLLFFSDQTIDKHKQHRRNIMTALMSFTPDLTVHVPAIDEQHKELIKRLNTLVELGSQSISKEETEKTLDFLGHYVVKHFGDEEVLQLKCGYPKYLWHRDQHRQFIETFKKIRAQYASGGVSLQLTLQINRSIIDWVVQ
jgi:hemerythrin